jgi:RimJ/RimL family protein N-acetyltransferase
MLLKLRTAVLDDCEMIWRWINDTTVRSVSFSEPLIPWKDHVLWFQERINKPHYYIAFDHDNIPVGQIRFDQQNSEMIISVLIDSQFRRRGYGSFLISLASKKLFSDSECCEIHAYVKEANRSSITAFIRAGYVELMQTEYKGRKALHFLLTKSIQ